MYNCILFKFGIIGRVNAIYKGTSWPDSNSNIRNLGFEIAEVNINPFARWLECLTLV